MRLFSVITFMALALIGSVYVQSCALEVEHTTSRRGHDNHHRGHHNHHYWNDAGEAYAEAASIKSLVVLPIELPATFTGNASEQDLKSWRESWPTKGAHLVASILGATPDIHVSSSVGKTKPKDGYYLAIKVTEYDIGDAQKANRGSGMDGWSKLNGIGQIFNAQTGKMVVDFAFDEQTVRYDERPSFESQLSNIGQNLADWFRDKQAGRP